MSLEQALAQNTAALVALTAALAALPQPGTPVGPGAPGGVQNPATQPQYTPPVQNAPAPAGTMPGMPFPGAPAPQQAQPPGLPFHDNVSAAAWATAAWQQMAAVNQDVAQQQLGALMQSLGAVDFNQITPDKFVPLYQGIQAIKASLGIQG